MEKRLLVILFFLIIGNVFLFATATVLPDLASPIEIIFDFLKSDLVKMLGGILLIGAAIAIGFMGFSQLPGVFTLLIAVGLGVNIEPIFTTLFGESIGFLF